MKSLVAFLMLSILLIIVYFIKRSILSGAEKPKDVLLSDEDYALLDKIEPLEQQLLQKEKEKEILIQQYKKVYEDLELSTAYAELQKKYSMGLIAKEAYDAQLDTLLNQIDLKMMDLDLY